MDLQSKKSKIILLIFSTVIMGIILYFNFRGKDEGTYKVSDKYSRTGKSDSESNINRTNKQMQKQYERDVKSYSFSDFLKNQIENDPESGNQPNPSDEADTQKNITDNQIIINTPKPETESSKVQSSEPETLNPKPETSNSKPETLNSKPETLNSEVRRLGFTGSQPVQTAGSQQTQQAQQSSYNIKAAVLQTKKIKAGDIILVRNTEEFIINNRKIPANTLIACNTSFSGSRLILSINAIPLGDESIPCNLTAYDLDGNKGLKLNRDIDYELKGDAANTVIRETSQAVRVPYLGELAKSVGSKTVNDPTVTIEQGQKMYLRLN